MIKEVLDTALNRPKDKVRIDKAILDAVVYIAKKDHGNILFLLSIDSYDNNPNFQESRTALTAYVRENMKDISFKQRLNGRDLRSTSAFNDIVEDLQNTNTNPEEGNEYERLILSVFTRSRAELDDIAIRCLALEDVSVYIL